MSIATDLKPIWNIADRGYQEEQLLVDELGISSVAATLLVQRGYSEPRDAEKFLNPEIEHLRQPTDLPDCEAALRRILLAKERNERIYVHGDYDVDGVSSAALLTRFLRLIGCDVVAHVPHRESEGFGIHDKAVQWAKESGAGLFLTCDCGTSANEQIDAVYELGMEAVITDHHQPPPILPRAHAIVNPHRKDVLSPCTELSGAGVVFKLCAAIASELGMPVDKYYRAFFDLAVLGTVADVMPLIDDNRVIARHGLIELRRTKKPGLQALLEVSDLSDPTRMLTTRHIGFQLGPRINAVGRIDDAGIALKMLLANELDEARTHARFLNEKNQERRTLQDQVAEQVFAEIKQRDLSNQYVIVVAQESLPKGIVGIVAGKVVDHFRRPAFVLTINDGVASGSARSLPGFNLADAIEELDVSGGGHAMAAGVSLPAKDVEEFAFAIDNYAKTVLTPDAFRPSIDIDVEVSMEEAGAQAASDLRKLEPFGESNPSPIFLCRNVTLVSAMPTKKPEHVRLTLGQGHDVRQAMGFGMGDRISQVRVGEALDVVFELEESEWNGQRRVQWILRDFQPKSS
ncbi:single-stranded-DNA-specific exonuclease RecJ [Kamptonema cortianum]|nr:single-stranded-DNA-specific exonuclease RecJ [Geitlerinema splendidum]MDK3156185.1 single-stranded-DNA-specific exonuclease RecJ [Kamptonema cortianum]